MPMLYPQYVILNFKKLQKNWSILQIVILVKKYRSQLGGGLKLLYYVFVCNFWKKTPTVAIDGDESIVVAILGNILGPNYIRVGIVYYFMLIITPDKVGENVGLCQDFFQNCCQKFELS